MWDNEQNNIDNLFIRSANCDKRDDIKLVGEECKFHVVMP